MSLLKINSSDLLTIFLLFSNFWIYRIFKENFPVGLLIVIASIIVVKFNNSKKAFSVIAIAILGMAIFQYQTTKLQSLTILDNDGQRVQSERITAYPPTYINLFFKVIWLKPVEWIEKNNAVIALSGIERNLFETLDFNKYFFGGFPRNSASDFEKFTFILLPIFLAGIFKLIKAKKIKLIALLFIFPLLIFSLFGNKNNLGPFLLFPFFILPFAEGINFLAKKFKYKKTYFTVLILLILMGFLIQISYAKI